MEKDFLNLALQEGSEERKNIPDSVILRRISDEYLSIERSINRIREALLLSGMKTTDEYFEMMKQTRFTSEETLIYPRVRFNSERHTVSFYWERLQRRIVNIGNVNSSIPSKYGRGYSYQAFVPNPKTGRKRKVKVCLSSKHIPINKTTKRISSSSFTNEPEWVRIAGEIVEKRLCLLRRENDAVASLSRALARMRNVLKEMENEG